ncbi:MAG: 2-hydroxycyclohexanecarboxyl-CoA dehydrogenase [Steroidobacteraceae bacterium]
MQTSRRLDGRIALVTGASRGIGRATALRLAAEGARIAVNYSTDEAGATATVRQIEAAGGIARAVRADVRDTAALETMHGEITAALGAPDILVNNAGTLVMGGALAMEAAALDEAIDINVAGPLACVQRFVPAMIERRRGRIVNVGATSAFGTTAAGVVPHAAAKAALLLWGKQLALELGKHGITVNAVCPGAIDTEITLPGGALHEALKDVRQQQLRNTALRRAGGMDEVAAVIAFLVSDDAAFVTGQAISVDGGRTDFLSRSG